MAPRKAAVASAHNMPVRAGTKRKADPDATADAPAKKAKSATAASTSFVMPLELTKTCADPIAHSTTRKTTTKATTTTKKVAPARKANGTKAAATSKSTTSKAAAIPQKEPEPKAIKKATGAKKSPSPQVNGITTATTTTASKRKADKEESAQASKKAKPLVHGATINEPPTERLNAYVFGEGSSGELGLGAAKNAIDVKRPRANPALNGVVKIAAGGMHALALTPDNKILSWGVNDQGALGRDTTWEGGLRDMDADEDSDSDSENNDLNPKESTPGEVDWSQTPLPDGTRFADIAAGDSCSFALTDDGRVYGWGTFRKADGIFGFTEAGNVVTRPVLIPDLKNIIQIAAGANFALALDAAGAVYAWGCGEQCQLGRRMIARSSSEGLRPSRLGLPRGPKNGVSGIACGNDHAFAISRNGTVYAWGNNTFGETGVKQFAGMEEAVVFNPTPINSLKGHTITSIKGGTHHTVASNDKGECLTWGRIDAAALGIPYEELYKLPEESLIWQTDEKTGLKQGKPRICAIPQRVTAIDGFVTSVAAAGDQSFAVTKEGKAWSWGFSANHQLGQGTEDDVEVATMMDNTAIREKHIVGAAAGAQFGIIMSKAE